MFSWELNQPIYWKSQGNKRHTLGGDESINMADGKTLGGAEKFDTGNTEGLGVGRGGLFGGVGGGGRRTGRV